MSLSTGTRLGPYEIVSALGAGGMGEVYRARDTRLDRDVAVKILPEAFGADAERIARFQREAKVLASLNHPNIAVIYGFEESEGVKALVMELVEGEDLARRLGRGAIPLDEALPVAKQIAEALEAAHEQGIVHRDLKPANITLRRDGTVKVLDFGLAKALEPLAVTGGDLTASPTITSPALTEMGIILGTAAYMSPEQAKGRPADKRSDVWAFGAVLYEMLSGQRAFKGDDITDTLAAVLRQDIDWTALPASTPGAVRRLMARCLDRDARRRLRDIGEARILLDDPVAMAGESAAALVAPPPRALWRRAIPFLLCATVVGVLAATAAWNLKPSTPRTVIRLQVPLPEGQSFTGLYGRVLDMSPDGTQIVYVANGRLYLRSMSETDVHPIQGTDAYGAVASPVFSPDGRWVAFHAYSDQTLKRVAVTGGASITICSAGIPSGMSWGPDGIVFAEEGKGIRRVSPTGDTPAVLVNLEAGEVPESPRILPGGERVMFTLVTGSAPNRWDTAQIVVQSISTAERKILVTGGTDARYVPTGHIVYAVSGTLFAAAFDPRRQQVGSPVPVVEGVMRASGGGGAANFSISDNGSLVYVPGSIASGQTTIAMTDRRKVIELLKLPPDAYAAPRVAPDGKRIAVGIDDGREASIYTYDLSGASGMRRLTFGGDNRYPIWTSNDRVAFQSDREGDRGIFWQPAVGGAVERLTRAEQGTSHVPEAWSPKGDAMLFSVTRGSEVSLWIYSFQEGKARPFGDVRSSTPTNAVFSPDGRWVAYTVTERNRSVIHIQPFPASGTQYQLPLGASEIASQPLWSPDGKELIYNPGPGRLAWTKVTTGPTVTFGNPEAVQRPFLTGPPAGRRPFDITPGGTFVGLIQARLTDSGTPPAPQIQVVLNWFEELKSRAATQ